MPVHYHRTGDSLHKMVGVRLVIDRGQLVIRSVRQIRSARHPAFLVLVSLSRRRQILYENGCPTDCFRTRPMSDGRFGRVRAYQRSLVALIKRLPIQRGLCQTGGRDGAFRIPGVLSGLTPPCPSITFPE
jgi:hypothetical protein